MAPDPAAPFDPAAIRAILLDIEGTTTPVEFVYGVLFPFARARMRSFLKAHVAEPQVRADVEALRREHTAEKHTASAERGLRPAVRSTSLPGASAPEAPLPEWPDSPEQLVESAAAYALWLMDRDRKFTPLKSLQGRIWEAGYVSGELRGQVYPDVPPALARWKRQGRRIAIFSSGSVQAQKLLYRYSDAGDLTPFLDGHFDTTVGPKREPQSYRHIAEALQLPPQSFLFISDVAAELDAARAAGMHTALCIRPCAESIGSSSHRVVCTFDEILSK